MTCIVGVEHNDRVYMAGDASVCLGKNEVATMHAAKVRIVNGLALGCAGDLRGHNLVMTWGAPTPPTEHVYPWLVREFVPAWQRDLQDATTWGSVPDVDLLVGVAGELYHVDADGAVYRKAEGFAALGNAADYALGVLHRGGWSTPKRRLTAALEAAAAASPWCLPPWTFVRV